jgi:glycosyltransferase involved in cell wall biosynthesis
MKLTVIIAAYNEAPTILKILERVKAQSIPDVTIETVVVDDGSTDSTVSLLKTNPHLYSKLVCREKNGGKGAAVRDGLKVAGGDYVLFQDADLEYDPAEYIKLIEPIKKYGAEVVLGSRTLGGESVRSQYFWNRLGNRLITRVFNLLYNKKLSDAYTCYLLYKKDLIQCSELRTSGFEQHGEILAKCLKRSCNCHDVAISYRGRSHAEGKKIRGYHIFPVIWIAFVERFRA